MEKDSEEKIVETFTETLRIINKNTIPCTTFVSKYNEWLKQFEVGFRSLSKTTENHKLSILPNRYLRISITSLITFCVLESIRCKNAACCLTGLAFFIFLISWNIFTAIVFNIPKHDESMNSIIFYVGSLTDLCKMMTTKLNHTRQVFKIISGPNCLHAISGCCYSPEKFKFKNFIHSWRSFCLCWFHVSGILFAVQISIGLYALELPDFPEILQYFSGLGMLFIALFQHRQIKKFHEEMQQNRHFLKAITSKYFQWFEKKCQLRTLMLRLGYLNLDVNESLDFKLSNFKNISVQCHLISTVAAVRVAYGLQYAIRKQDLSDVVRYFLFNKPPKQNLRKKQKIVNEELAVLHTSTKEDKFTIIEDITNFITSQRITSNLPAVVLMEDHFTKQDNVTTNESDIRTENFSNSNELNTDISLTESTEETERNTLGPVPSPESSEHIKQEELELLKDLESMDISQLKDKTSEINRNICNQEISCNANVLKMATKSYSQDQTDNFLKGNGFETLSNSLPCLFYDAESTPIELDAANTPNLNAEDCENHNKELSDINLLNDTFGRKHKCCQYIWNNFQTAHKYLHQTRYSSENSELNNALEKNACCRFIWNHCKAFENALNHINSGAEFDISGDYHKNKINSFTMDDTKTKVHPSTPPLINDYGMAKKSENETTAYYSREKDVFKIIQDSASKTVFENTDPYYQIDLEKNNKNIQHLVDLADKIKENDIFFQTAKVKCKRTRNAESRSYKKYSSSSEDESSYEVNGKIRDCLNIKRMSNVSNKSKLRQEENSKKTQSRLPQWQQPKLIKMRHRYEISEEEKEEKLPCLSLSDKININYFKSDSATKSANISVASCTLANDNNQFKFESSNATENPSMLLPTVASNSQPEHVSTPNRDHQQISTSLIDNHSEVESSPDTNKESPLMTFKARNSVLLSCSQFKEQTNFKNNTSVSTQVSNSDLLMKTSEEPEQYNTLNSKNSDTATLITDKRDTYQSNQLLNNFKSSVEDYCSNAKTSGSSSNCLKQNEGKIFYHPVADIDNQTLVGFEYVNDNSRFDLSISNTEKYLNETTGGRNEHRTETSHYLNSKSDFVINKGSSTSYDTFGFKEDNSLLNSNKSPQAAADKNSFSWKKECFRVSEKEEINDTKEDLQRPMKWISDMIDPSSDSNKGAFMRSSHEENKLSEDLANQEYAQSSENITEPLSYSLKCGNMNLQFTENSPHVTLRFICENNEDITEQNVPKHQISQIEHISGDEFIFSKHNVLEGSNSNKDFSFTVKSANGNSISKSRNLKRFDGAPSTMKDTCSHSSGFLSDPPFSENSSTESDTCSESQRSSPVPEDTQSPFTTDGQFEEIPMAFSEDAEGNINQDLHFETDNVKLNFVPNSNSGSLQISYRHSFRQNRLIFKSNDKKLKLKTKK